MYIYLYVYLCIYLFIYLVSYFFFCDTFFTAIGHMVRSPVLEGGGWGGGVISSRFGEEIEKRGRVAVGVVGGAQG